MMQKGFSTSTLKKISPLIFLLAIWGHAGEQLVASDAQDNMLSFRPKLSIINMSFDQDKRPSTGSPIPNLQNFCTVEHEDDPELTEPKDTP